MREPDCGCDPGTLAITTRSLVNNSEGEQHRRAGVVGNRRMDRPNARTGEGCAHAQVGAVPKGQVLTGVGTVDAKLVRVLESAWVAAHRLQAARRGVEKFGCVVLLKGNETIVASPEPPTLVTALSTPALATAGTGDVLTGIVAAFLAKGLAAPLAAAAAAVAQNVAASLGPQAGLVAHDVVDRLPRALDEPGP